MKHSLSTLFFIIIFSACGNDPHFDKQTYSKNKERLSDKEKNNPLDFLKVSGENRKNFFGLGSKTVVEGIISNGAAVCAYKDVRIKMLCYDNGKMVEEHEDIIKDVIKPATTKDFKIRYRLPKGTDSLGLSVMSASAVSISADEK